MNFKFKTLIQLIDYFKDEKTCFEFLGEQVWGGTPFCPHCGSNHVYQTKTRSKSPNKQDVPEYRCGEKGCSKNFSATVGTIFEGTKLPLRIWFGAIWLCTTSSKGISSLNLSKQLGITQKSAWFVLSRVREMFKETYPDMLTGEVEIDEIYIGGKDKNKHKSNRSGQRGMNTKTPMVGLLQREGKVVLKVIGAGTANGEVIKPIVRDNVSKEATIITDGFGAYSGLDKEFKEHGIVRHDRGEYVRGKFHTNSIEGFWGIMSRGIIGVYHQTSAKHLQRYCNEYSYRYNNRESDSVLKFRDAIAKVVNARITYKTLIGK